MNDKIKDIVMQHAGKLSDVATRGDIGAMLQSQKFVGAILTDITTPEEVSEHKLTYVVEFPSKQFMISIDAANGLDDLDNITITIL